MARHATLYDFTDRDLMFRIAEASNGGVPTAELADMLGFEEGDNRGVGIRLAWMKRYGMVAFDDRERTWSLTRDAQKVVDTRRSITVVEKLPDESMVDVMAYVSSRYHAHQNGMLAAMLRREFLYGTRRR